MRLRILPAALFALALVFSGCGDDDDDDDGATASDTETTEGSGETSGSTDDIGDDSEIGSTPVMVTDSDYGEILATQDGFTLYAFTNDTDGTPTCVEACAGTWPPMLLEEVPEVEGVDEGVLSIVEGPDGNQLKAGDYPLYLYSGDAEAGETNGHGVGDVWFAVAPDGSLIEATAGGEGEGEDGSGSTDTTASDY